ncbi:MAG TPA: hypothetical protein VNJ08_01755 [Bacteriovoracaceae bacterium]|nr:hypothetical protein [Bacteriovoracaceae bacterium]
MLSLKIHNIMDYVIALVLILSPFLFGFSDVEVARNVYLVLGIGLAGYSLITKYYYSVAKIIPVGIHMILDVLAGIVLVFAPYIFDYRISINQGQMIFHVVMGLGAITLVAITRTRTERAKSIEELSITSGANIRQRRHV